jgi:hypothetical protein
MNVRAWILSTLLALLACSSAGAAEPRIGKFTRYDTGDFVIITSRSASQARQFMQNLTKFRLTLEKLLGKRAARSGIGTHIVIVSGSDWEKYLQPRKEIAGYFQRAMFDNYMSMNGDAGDYAIYIMFHEYTHFYLSSQFAGEYPPWFNEGLAEFMAYARFTPKGVQLMIPDFRAQEARDKDWIPFERLIRIDQYSPEYQSHKLADSFYAQAWLTVHYGMLENREFGQQYFNYLNQLNQLVPREEAARKAFGDLDAVDANLRAYSRKNNKFSGVINLGEIPEIDLPKGEPMSDADAIAALVDLQLATRVSPERMRPLVESLLRREPEAARSHIIAARVAEFEDKHAQFDAAVDKAAKLLSADDWQGQRDLGLVLLANADKFDPLSARTPEDTKRDLKRSLTWLASSVEKHSEDPKSLWGLGTVLTRLDSQLDVADTALQAAYQRVPASAAIAMSLANLKSRQEKYEEMLPYLRDVIRYADDLGMRRWAADTQVEMEKYLAERARIDEENRRQREAYEKQLADHEKKYGKPKKKKTAQ